MSDPTYFTDTWQTKEVLDPENETSAYESIIQMVYDHKLACICHVIMSNYTWKQSDIQKLIPFYETLGKDLNEKILKLQQNSEPTAFGETSKKLGLLDLPIYSKCVDSSLLVAESTSRVFHDAKEYLNNGSATESEINHFVSTTLKKVLDPLFTPKEIRNVLKHLIPSLAQSRKRDEEIGEDVKKDSNYELARSLGQHSSDFPKFHEKLSSAISNFIGYFALHTIRQHCFVNFGVDGELKFYQREMYKRALEDLRTNKSKPIVTVKPEVSVKRESQDEKSPKKATVTRIKPEMNSESDDDFCEIIEPIPSKKPKSRHGSESNGKDVKETKDFPEKYMLEDLDKDELPMNFKTKFRKLVEQNQMLRDEINDYKELIQLKIAEKKKEMA